MNDESDLTDLVARLPEEDRAKIERLYYLLLPSLRAAVRRQLHPRLRVEFDSLDFVQDVWASVLDTFKACTPSKWPFSSPDRLASYLARVARGKVADVFRQRFLTRKRNIVRECGLRDVGADQLCRVGPNPSSLVIASETIELLERSLPAAHKCVVGLLVDGYTHEDIARMTGLSVSTVNRIVRRLKDVSAWQDETSRLDELGT